MRKYLFFVQKINAIICTFLKNRYHYTEMKSKTMTRFIATCSATIVIAIGMLLFFFTTALSNGFFGIFFFATRFFRRWATCVTNPWYQGETKYKNEQYVNFLCHCLKKELLRISVWKWDIKAHRNDRFASF